MATQAAIAIREQKARERILAALQKRGVAPKPFSRKYRELLLAMELESVADALESASEEAIPNRVPAGSVAVPRATVEYLVGVPAVRKATRDELRGILG